MIDKGFISSIDEDKKLAVIVPMSAGAAVTHNLVIPYFLRECLQVNMPVVYATFEDNTGIILARMDGEWNHIIYEQVHVKGDVKTDGVTETTDDITTTGNISSPGLDTAAGSSVIKGSVTVQGSVTASGDVTGAGISLQGHTHGYTHGGTASGSDTTTPAQ